MVQKREPWAPIICASNIGKNFSALNMVSLIALNQLNLVVRSSRIDLVRCLHVSQAREGRLNFRKFTFLNKVGQYDMKHTPKHFFERELAHPVCMDSMRQRYPGYWVNDTTRRRVKKVLKKVKEMEPELIVPNLEDFPLKPYVSYRAPYVEQTELTARALFNVTYAKDIMVKYEKGEEVKVEVSEEEITAARVKATQTGADLFVEKGWYGIPRDIKTDAEMQEEQEQTFARWKRLGKFAKPPLEQVHSPADLETRDWYRVIDNQ